MLSIFLGSYNYLISIIFLCAELKLFFSLDLFYPALKELLFADRNNLSYACTFRLCEVRGFELAGGLAVGR